VTGGVWHARIRRRNPAVARGATRVCRCLNDLTATGCNTEQGNGEKESNRPHSVSIALLPLGVAWSRTPAKAE
jgi:hypothetical protein